MITIEVVEMRVVPGLEDVVAGMTVAVTVTVGASPHRDPDVDARDPETPSAVDSANIDEGELEEPVTVAVEVCSPKVTV